MRILLDTNVLSELLRKRPEPRVVERAREIPVGSAFTSIICVMELRCGALRRGGEPGRRLWSRIARELLPTLTVLPVGDAEGSLAAELMAALDERGTPIGLEDVLIGATARARDLRVATRNLRHFERLDGVRAESWWPA